MTVECPRCGESFANTQGLKVHQTRMRHYEIEHPLEHYAHVLTRAAKTARELRGYIAEIEDLKSWMDEKWGPSDASGDR